jgi:hypothetical protein
LREGVTVETIKLMAARQAGRAYPTGGVRTGPDNLPRISNVSFYPDPLGPSGPPREALRVPDGTPVRLRLTRNLSSGQATMDDRVHF